MINRDAVKINDRLGVKIFRESNIKRLEIIKYSKKEIKEMMIDDLVNEKGQGTDRLGLFVKDILFGDNKMSNVICIKTRKPIRITKPNITIEECPF